MGLMYMTINSSQALVRVLHECGKQVWSIYYKLERSFTNWQAHSTP